MTERIYQIRSTTFTAEISFSERGQVVRVAPEIAYMQGRTERWVANLCRDRAWQIEPVQNGEGTTNAS